MHDSNSQVLRRFLTVLELTLIALVVLVTAPPAAQGDDPPVNTECSYAGS